jgi:hypothetical protein
VDARFFAAKYNAHMSLTLQPSSSDAKRAIWISLGVTLLLGGSYIAVTWVSRGHGEQAVRRCALFVLLMIVAHALGFELYQRQPIRWSPFYPPAVRAAYLQQVLAIVLSSVVLLSQMGMIVATGSIGFWVGVVIIACRRPESPSKLDLLFIRCALIPLCVVATWMTINLPGLLRIRW